jgi:hypothetical protein
LDLFNKSITPIKSSDIKADNDDNVVQPQIEVPAPSPVLPPQEAPAPIKRGRKGKGKGSKKSKVQSKNSKVQSNISEVQSPVQPPATVHSDKQVAAKRKLPKGWVIDEEVNKDDVEQPIEPSDPTMPHNQKDQQSITRSRKRKEIPNPNLPQRSSTRLKTVSPNLLSNKTKIECHTNKVHSL